MYVGFIYAAVSRLSHPSFLKRDRAPKLLIVNYSLVSSLCDRVTLLICNEMRLHMVLPPDGLIHKSRSDTTYDLLTHLLSLYFQITLLTFYGHL
jgi:hypothetical protein